MKVDRWPRKHPLCTCLDWTPGFNGEPPPDRSACRGGTIAHPMIGVEEMRHLVEVIKREAQNKRQAL